MDTDSREFRLDLPWSELEHVFGSVANCVDPEQAEPKLSVACTVAVSFSLG
jgi:hypothetical protein